MNDKKDITTAINLISKIAKSENQDIWTQAERVLRELDSLMYEITAEKRDKKYE